MAKDSDQYSVVLLGHMNPRIHHPIWYAQVELFSREEVDVAVQTQPIVCTPAFSQFGVDDLLIKCLQDRWDITTANPAKIDRIREIAERIFDKLLPHTPVTVIALNYDFTRQTSRGNATRFVAEIVNGAAARIGLPSADGGELFLKRALETIPELQGIATVAIKSTDDADLVGLFCNYQYTAKFRGPYEMANFLPGYARRDRADAEACLVRLLSAIESPTRE